MTPGKHRHLSAAWSVFAENPVLLIIAGIGFAVSFQTISAEARLHQLPGWPVLYPLLIDAGIFGFAAEARKAVDDGRSDFVPRGLAWLLSLFTLYVNAHGSPSRDWVGITLHVAAPCLWIAFLELTRWRKIRAARPTRDRIPLARWFIAPRRTAGMRKRMILHNIASYTQASAREEARLLAIDLAEAVFGKRWTHDAPRLLVHHLTEGTLPSDVAQACTAGQLDVPELVNQWVTGAKEQRARAAARARQIDATATAAPPATPARKPGRQKKRQAAAATGWRDKAAGHVADNPSIRAADLADLVGVSKRTAERYLTGTRPDAPVIRLGARA